MALPGCSVDDVVIAMMGGTGTGKSSFIQLLTGDTTVKVGNDIESETSDVQVVRFLDSTTNRNIIVVDTPGFDDSRNCVTDTDILTRITNFLLSEYDKDRKLNGLVYFQRISDPRFGSQATRNLRLFRSLCGADNFKNVIVLTTFWDIVNTDIGSKREDQLKSKIFNDLFAAGASLMRHDGTVEGAHQVLRHILPFPPTTLLIQKEIREEGKSLEDTNAGSVRREEVEQLITKHKKEIADTRAEMEAMKDSNKEAMKELGRERAKLQKELQHWEAERLALKRGLESEKKSREQLEEEAKWEKEKHEKWCQDQERKLFTQLGSQAKVHSTELRSMQAKFDQEQKDRAKKELEERAKLQKELELREVEISNLQKILESERKSRKLLEDEAKKEKETHEKWRQDLERNISAQLDSQAKADSATSRDMQAKLDQGQEDPAMQELEKWKKSRVDRRGLVLAFDVGTTYSGISYSLLDPGETPEIKGITRFPANEHISGASKIPTIIYYDRDGKVRAVGAEAMREGIYEIAEDENWVKAEWFMLHLRSNVDTPTSEILPLPLNKTVVEVFADFLRYLLECASSYIQNTHAGGPNLWDSVKDEIDFVLSHHNGWESTQQSQMRRAAVLAGLISDTTTGHFRLSFVTEGEATLHFSIKQLFPGATKDGDGFTVVRAGNGTIDVSSYSRNMTTAKKAFEEVAAPQCHLNGSVFVSIRARLFLEKLLAGSYFVEDLDHIIRCFDKTTKMRFKCAEEPQYIKFGSVRHNDKACNIRCGQLKLMGSDVASFFEPSVNCIVKAVLDQKKSARESISYVVLTGELGVNDWVFKKVLETLTPLGLRIFRLDYDVNRAVSDGAISFYLDSVISPIAEATVVHEEEGLFPSYT